MTIKVWMFSLSNNPGDGAYTRPTRLMGNLR